MGIKKTPNKKMPVGKKTGGGYTAKGPKGSVKVTGKKKLPSAQKSNIKQSIEKVKF